MKINHLPKVHINMNTTRVIVIGILVTIIIGSILLYLPISNNKPISFFDAYFIATSATCVTGHSTVVIENQFSVFGQIVIALLMEIGGLGFMLLITMILLFLKRKITLGERKLISQSISTNTLGGLVSLVIKIIKFTIFTQVLGTVILSIEFVPKYGRIGIFKALFHCISSFNNAGFDILGNNSLQDFRNSFIVNVVTIILTIIGGLGFIVWDDIFTKVKNGRKENKNMRRIILSFNCYTKLVLSMTAILIVLGSFTFYILEYNNVKTIGNLSPSGKILTSIFQTVNCRSTGMCSIDLSCINSATKMIMMFLMFIGGASGSTSGGIKVTTLAIIILVMIAYIEDRKKIKIFNRQITQNSINKAISVFFISFLVIILSTIIMCIMNDSIQMNEILFENISSFGNVGLSLGITKTLNIGSKAVSILLMTFGRIGTITMACAFVVNKPKQIDNITYPEENIIVG